MRSTPRARGRRRWSLVALVLQVALFPHLAWEGIVPNFCLLVVVAAALVRGPAFAATLGFFAGPAARPRPAGRPRRRSLGARPRRRRLRRRADAPGHPPDRDHGGRHGRGLVVHRHVGLRAVRARAAATPWPASGDLRPDRSWSSLLWDVLADPARAPRRDAAAHQAGAGERLDEARPRRTPAAERSRLRLVVVQVLVFSLFATLFARLYYLQVVSRRRLPRRGRLAVAARGRGPARSAA